MTSKRRSILAGAALFLICIAAYIPTIRADFIWDDDDYVQNNQTLRSLKGLWRIWTEPTSIPQYYPLVHTTFWLEYHIWQLKPTGYHIVNIILHALTGVVFWRVLRRLSIPWSWAAAAVFILHPVNVESAAWIAERKNILSGLFYMGALLSYIRFDIGEQPGRLKGNYRFYIVSLLLFAGALLSKTVTCTLAAVLLLLIWRKRGRISAADAARTAVFFLAGLAFGLVTIWLEKHHVGARGEEWGATLLEKFLIAGRVPWFYMGKLIYPVNLIFVYPRWEIDAGQWRQYLYPIALIVAVIVLFVLRGRIGRGPFTIFLIFIIMLFPALGFIDVYPMRYSFVADHYQYLATPWFAAIVACFFGWMSNKYGPATKRFFGIAFAAVLILLGILTWDRCGVFRNPETLWRDTLEKNPGCWMAYNNMGNYMQGKGRIDEAIYYYRKSYELEPNYGTAVYNLGNALQQKGETKEAIACLIRATEIEPDFAAAYYSLGNAYKDQNDFNGAIASYSKAIEINPDYGLAHFNLANTLKEMGQKEDAVRHYRETIRSNPEYGKAHYQLAMSIKADDTIAETVRYLREAVRLMPDSAVAFNELAWILATYPDAKIRNGDEALALAEKAARLTDFKNPVILDTLAAAYAETGQFDRAADLIRKALAMPEMSQSPRLLEQLKNSLQNYHKALPTRASAGSP